MKLKQKLKKSLIFVISVITVLLCITCVFFRVSKAKTIEEIKNNKETHIFSSLNDVESARIIDDIYEAIDDVQKRKNYVFIYRYMRTDGFSGAYPTSYIAALTKKNEFYVISGSQPYVMRKDKRDEDDLLYAIRQLDDPEPVYTVFSESETNRLKRLLSIVKKEYRSEKVDTNMEKYPPAWHHEIQIFVNNSCLDFDPDILDIPYSNYNSSYSDYDKNFQSLDLPAMEALYYYMMSIDDEAENK